MERLVILNDQVKLTPRHIPVIVSIPDSGYDPGLAAMPVFETVSAMAT